MATASAKQKTKSIRSRRPGAGQEPKSNGKKICRSRFDTPQLHKGVRQLLEKGLNPYELKLNSNLLAQLHDNFVVWIAEQQTEVNEHLKKIPVEHREQWLNERLMLDRRRSENSPGRFLCDFLREDIPLKLAKIGQLKKANQDFRQMLASTSAPKDRQELILQYAAQLGASRRDLDRDRKAFTRWFDEEAVVDRFQKIVGSLELSLSFMFDRLSQVIIYILDTAFKPDAKENDSEKLTKRTDRRETDRRQTTGCLPEGLLVDRRKGSRRTFDRRDGDRCISIWNRINTESRLQQTLACDCDQRVHTSAMRSLRMTFSHLATLVPYAKLQPSTALLISRSATNKKLDVWQQCEALSVLADHSWDDANAIYEKRLKHNSRDDDMFVRRHIWQIVQKKIEAEPEFEFDVELASDESEFVRQQTARALFLSSSKTATDAWHRLRSEDSVAQVRAAALVAGLEFADNPQRIYTLLEGLASSLEHEQDAFVARVALHVSVELLDKLVSHLTPKTDQQGTTRKLDSTINSIYRQQLVPLISKLKHKHESIEIRRRGAEAYEKIWALLDEEARVLLNRLRPELKNIRPGKSKFWPSKNFAGLPKAKICRILAVLAQEDFGYDFHPGWLVTRIKRGPKFGFRLWRFVFEFSNVATDKRQALRHTVGRISTANFRAPSQILGELSETKVPGEPFTIAGEGGWRPFLPLPDDFVSVLNKSWFWPQTVQFYSSQGITRVRGPRNIFRRISAGFAITFKFAKYAALRNWDNETYPAGKYVDSLRELGFEIEFEAHAPIGTDDSQQQHTHEVNVDSSVSQFFGAAAVTLPVSATLLATSVSTTIWNRLKEFSDYFVSPFENSLPQLVFFSLAILFVFLAKHFFSNYTFRKARNRIPFALGGWGTRGKSGTERLKAALVGVMGHGLVSKTTGCEAMFIHGYPNGEPLEIPLFRPYDKATIWEQRNLIVMASKMEPSVFLWECMALNPNFVDVLQRQWTNDDIATITNTYPDHEDIQGPAGHNVATTISGFVPLKSHLITTEEIMRPYVTESCRHAGSTFEGVGWLESGLITDDVLDRFPYQEHPNNIALVAAMAAKMGCSYEFSLKAMADFLVPDLGVLKTSAISDVRTRKFEFTNGCSANERFGCMGNWKRLGFDSQDPWESPTTWVCGVVNNRADRIPRSKVFAKIIVEDINADRFFLIGSNLEGLQTFISEAWTERAATITLRDQDKNWNAAFALEVLKQAAWDFRQPIEPANVQDKLKCMIDAVASESGKDISFDLENKWNDKDALKSTLQSAQIDDAKLATVAKHHEELLKALFEYKEMQETLTDAPESIADTVEQKFIDMLRTWYPVSYTHPPSPRDQRGSRMPSSA